MTLGVAIGTFGDKDVWSAIAKRAIASVEQQSMSVKYQWSHRDTLHEARNEAASQLIDRGCNWLCFLDADDELDKDYCLNMAAQASIHIAQRVTVNDRPILQPSTIGVRDGVEDVYPYLMPATKMLERNYLTIGCVHPAELFERIGGFEELPLWEDWLYWLQAYFTPGTNVVPVPDAVYRVHIDSARRSRNQPDDMAVVSETMTKIRARFAGQSQGYLGGF